MEIRGAVWYGGKLTSRLFHQEFKRCDLVRDCRPRQPSSWADCSAGWRRTPSSISGPTPIRAGKVSDGRRPRIPASCCQTESGRTSLLALAPAPAAAAAPAPAENSAQPADAGKKPNILVIFGDDIGQTNISAYTMGLMGYRTPNIDRVAKEGMIFTDYYAEQSCTAGRSSFITGQCTFRTGL